MDSFLKLPPLLRSSTWALPQPLPIQVRVPVSHGLRIRPGRRNLLKDGFARRVIAYRPWQHSYTSRPHSVVRWHWQGDALLHVIPLQRPSAQGSSPLRLSPSALPQTSELLQPYLGPISSLLTLLLPRVRAATDRWPGPYPSISATAGLDPHAASGTLSCVPVSDLLFCFALALAYLDEKPQLTGSSLLQTSGSPDLELDGY